MNWIRNKDQDDNSSISSQYSSDEDEDDDLDNDDNSFSTISNLSHLQEEEEGVTEMYDHNVTSPSSVQLYSLNPTADLSLQSSDFLYGDEEEEEEEDFTSSPLHRRKRNLTNITSLDGFERVWEEIV